MTRFITPVCLRDSRFGTYYVGGALGADHLLATSAGHWRFQRHLFVVGVKCATNDPTNWRNMFPLFVFVASAFCNDKTHMTYKGFKR